MTRTAEARDILILDDELAITRALRRLLGMRHRVRCAATPAEALALIEARLPDVLLSDYQLAEVTADAFLRQVKARWPSIRCILHSASQRDRWTGLLEDGVLDAVLLKPASVPELLALVESRPR
ncbi:MAG: response regulator [Deltaproteobacteria bacterium]|nr:response regulator [Deltaproteobacteria bacterium]